MPTRKRYNDGGMVASTILEQLGGMGRLKAMIGAYNFIDIGNGVSFRMKNPRANYVKIKLNSLDLYDLEVGRIRGDAYKIISEQKNVYAEDLKPLIEKASGLYLSLSDGGYMAAGGKVDTQGNPYVNVYARMKAKDYFGVESKGDAVKWFKLNAKPMSRKEAENWYQTKKSIDKLGKSNVYIGNIEYSGQRRFIREDGGMLADGGEIFQIKDSKDRYYSKMGWNDSPDLGYLYTLEDAQKLLKSLSKDFFNLQIAKYNKDWWKMADGGELSIKNKLSKSSFALPYQIAIYVPSTKDKNIVISDFELESRVDEVKKYLSQLFGGFNSVKVEGGYESKDRGLIKEDAVRVVAFANKEDINEKIKKLISKIKYWCSEWGQESMGVEFENDMYYVDENTKFALGGYVDLSKQKPDVMQDSSFKVPEIDLIKIDNRTFKGSQIIRGSEDAVEIFRQFWNKNSLPISENLNVMLLNQANKPIGIYQHSKGSVNGTIADPEMIALAAVKSLAKGVIIAHNHPSGNLTPSKSDIDIANKIKDGLRLFDIKLLDSLIITEDSYNSLTDTGDMARGGKIMSDGGDVEYHKEMHRDIIMKAIIEDDFEFYGTSDGVQAVAKVEHEGDIYTVTIEAGVDRDDNSRYTITEIDSNTIDSDIFHKEDYKILNEFYNDLRNMQFAKGGRVNKKWIQEALKNHKEGSLRRTAKREGLLRGDEKLSMTDLHKLEKMGGKTAKRAYLAETLRKFK